MSHKYRSLEEAAENDPLISAAMKHGVPSEEVILCLIDQREALAHRLRLLEVIAPKKVRGHDGTIWIYRCPDHLIPDY